MISGDHINNHKTLNLRKKSISKLLFELFFDILTWAWCHDNLSLYFNSSLRTCAFVFFNSLIWKVWPIGEIHWARLVQEMKVKFSTLMHSQLTSQILACMQNIIWKIMRKRLSDFGTLGILDYEAVWPGFRKVKKNFEI